jgi:flagellar motility protein MotE (MotC chaperone)
LVATFARAAETLETTRDAALAEAAGRLAAAVVEELHTRLRGPSHTLSGLLTAVSHSVETQSEQSAAVGIKHGTLQQAELSRIVEMETGNEGGEAAPIFAPVAVAHALDIATEMQAKIANNLLRHFVSEGNLN